MPPCRANWNLSNRVDSRPLRPSALPTHRLFSKTPIGNVGDDGMAKRTWVILAAALSFHSGRAVAADGSQASSSAVEFFEKNVRPLLVDNCYNCHSANTNAKGGLRVDDRNGLLHGGNAGAAVVPGHPEKSLLIKAVGYD